MKWNEYLMYDRIVNLIILTFCSYGIAICHHLALFIFDVAKHHLSDISAVYSVFIFSLKFCLKCSYLVRVTPLPNTDTSVLDMSLVTRADQSLWADDL